VAPTAKATPKLCGGWLRPVWSRPAWFDDVVVGLRYVPSAFLGFEIMN
jgi:hypothetical protein